MNYRLATVEDCVELTNLRLAMRKERGEEFDELQLKENTFDFFQRKLPIGEHVAIVCEKDKAVVATMGLSFFEMTPNADVPTGKLAKMMNVYVLPDYRNNGIAEKLLGLALDYVKDKGCDKVILNASPMAKHLYEKTGFLNVGDAYEFSVLTKDL